MVIWFFHPSNNSQWPPTSKDFYPRFYSLHFRKSQYFSAKQGNYWYHFYNVFGMTRSLTGDWTRDLPHSKPACTLPLGYRGGSIFCTISVTYNLEYKNYSTLIKDHCRTCISLWNFYWKLKGQRGVVVYTSCNRWVPLRCEFKPHQRLPLFYWAGHFTRIDQYWLVQGF